MTGTSESDSHSEDSDSEEKTLWKRLLTVPGIALTTALTAAISWGVSLGLTQLSASSLSPQDAIAITAEVNPNQAIGISDADREVVLPATRDVKDGPGPGCSGFYDWGVRNGGVDADNTVVELIVQGKRDGAVLLNGMRFKILTKDPPLKGAVATCPSAGSAQRRDIEIDLDSSNPNAIFKQAGAIAPFGFTIAKGETETFIVSATTKRASYRWMIELDVVVDGKPSTISVGPPGGFQTTAIMPDTSHWEWNFTDAWQAVDPKGQSLPRPKVPAGSPLPSLE